MCDPGRMEEIYRDTMDADCIVIASPVYFSTLTGPLLSLMSRLQMFYTAGRMQGVHLIEKNKMGGILLCGGNGSPACAEEVARGLLRAMHTQHLGTVCTPPRRRRRENPRPSRGSGASAGLCI